MIYIAIPKVGTSWALARAIRISDVIRSLEAVGAIIYFGFCRSLTMIRTYVDRREILVVMKVCPPSQHK